MERDLQPCASVLLSPTAGCFDEKYFELFIFIPTVVFVVLAVVGVVFGLCSDLWGKSQKPLSHA